VATTVKELQKRVNKGAKWLDKNHPDWWKKIVPEKLDLSKGTVCVLGQTFNGFVGPFEVDGFDAGKRYLPEGTSAAQYGFDLMDEHEDGDENCSLITDVPGSIVGLVVEVPSWSVLDVMWLTKLDERQQWAKEERRAKRAAKVA
jgi:hypothetical protein